MIVMRRFIIQMNHPLVDFELNNLTESRMDLVARCVNSSLWLDHEIRRDVEIIFCFSNSKTIRINGEIRGMHPDERNITSFLKLLISGRRFPGIFLESKDLLDVINERKGKRYILDIKGKDIEKEKVDKNADFVLGDDAGLTFKPRADKISLGKVSYLTSHCITIINNRIDRL